MSHKASVGQQIVNSSYQVNFSRPAIVPNDKHNESPLISPYLPINAYAKRDNFGNPLIENYRTGNANLNRPIIHSIHKISQPPGGYDSFSLQEMYGSNFKDEKSSKSAYNSRFPQLKHIHPPGGKDNFSVWY